MNLLSRAVELVPEGDARPGLLVRLGRRWPQAGELSGVRQLVKEAVALAQAAGDAHVEWLGRILLAEVRSLREPEGAAEAMLREAEAAIEAREVTGDNEVLARAWKLMADGHGVMGRMGEYAPALDRAAAYARRAGDVRLEASYTNLKAPYFIFGPGRVEEGLRFVDEVLEPLRRVPGVQAWALHVRAHMRARVGEFDGAFGDMIEFRRRLRELGRERMYAVTSGCLWDVCLWAGDWNRGEKALREGYEMLEEMGNKAISQRWRSPLVTPSSGRGCSRRPSE